ncbi:iron-containing alcohol dehydrogenase family protein [Flavobacteriaceae bacterium D16]|nr:iron-containing alcohol dehydrogenase family protein [Flavobacteriaceae bacterium D16]
MNKKEEIETPTAKQQVPFRNFPMVPKVVFGRGSFDQLGDILLPNRKSADAPMIFLVDDVFEGTDLVGRLPVIFQDQLIFISADEEPSTTQVDTLVARIKADHEEEASGIIGIGGGTLLDLAKAVSIMLNNKGSSSEYQGWDLVQRPSYYHVGIPTISGTGAEVSRTTVLSGPKRKLGINSDYSTFDQVILDPDLTQGVPKDQWFYTGMDCYIHCIESLQGTYLNAFSQSYGDISLQLCRDVFLGDLSPEESRDKLMMASWHGGMSIAYSQVGVAHAMSYGLSFVLGIRHGLGNCLVFQHLEEFYPKGVAEFKQMMAKHDVILPSGICKHLSEEELDQIVDIALGMVPLWENALGPDWQSKVSPEDLKRIYRKI